MLLWIADRLPCRLRSRRGISIIGTVFTLIILSLMGAAMVAIVSDEQESRMRSLSRERAFYAVQAGFEYALREIREGGYPIVTAKPLAHAAFTTTIEPTARRITATGSAYEAERAYSITTSQLARDCASLNSSGAHLGGSSANELLGLTISRSCLNAVNVAAVTVTWTPNVGERVRRIRIGGVEVFYLLGGKGSGEPIDIEDARISGSSAAVDTIEFSSGMSGRTVDITLTFTDSSSVSRTGIAL